jgi:ribosomal protein L7Ae-like RNA K-turn-binding protein
MTIPPNIKALLGFAKKCGVLACGESAVKGSMKRKEIELLILAEDLPAKRQHHWKRWFEKEGVSWIQLGTKQEYGEILKDSPLGVLAIKDKQMAAAIKEKLNLAKKGDQQK